MGQRVVHTLSGYGSAGYRWLVGHTRHGFAIFALVALALLPIVVGVDGINIRRGQFTFGNGYTVGGTR